MTPTQRTLKHLRSDGWEPDIVERSLPGPAFRIRRDFFNCIDIIAVRDGETVGVQSCGQAFAAHDRKILAEEKALKWLNGGNRLILIGWRKLKLKRGGRAKVWKPRIKEYTTQDFVAKTAAESSTGTECRETIKPFIARSV